MNRYTYVFFLLLTFILLDHVRCDCFCSGNYSYPQRCVTDCAYQLEWCYNNIDQEVNFQVTSNVLNRWMGVGFSPVNEGPQNSDLILAWINEEKRFIMNDVWVDDNFMIHSDSNQSIYNVSAILKDQSITYKFSRKLVTNDVEHDFDLDQCFYLLYPIRGGPIDLNKKPIKYIKHIPFIISSKICLKQCSQEKAIKELESSLAKLILSLMAQVEKSVNISDLLPSKPLSTTSSPSTTTLPTTTSELNHTLLDNSISVNETKLMMAESKKLADSNHLVASDQNVTSLLSATSLSATTSDFNKTVFENGPEMDVDEITTEKMEKSANENKSLISELNEPLIPTANTSETSSEFEERKHMNITELLRCNLNYIVIIGTLCLLLLFAILMNRRAKSRKQVKMDIEKCIYI